MAARLDDALIHQNYGTLDQVVEDDPRWFDRFYFNAHAIDGSLSVAHGIGVYPNTRVMDGFVCAASPEAQTNVRASRELAGGDRDVMVIGPIRAEIVEGLKRWHFRLEENPYGVTYDLAYTATFEAMEPRRLVSVVDGRRVWDWTHFTQVGVVEGWVSVDGKRIEVTRDRFRALRDRSWGVRPGVAIVEDMREWFKQAKWGVRYNWVCLQLPSFHLWYFQTHEQDEAPRHFEGLLLWNPQRGGALEEVARLERRLEFEPGEHFRSAEVDVHLRSGRVVTVRFRRLGTTAHLRGGMYGGLGGVIHGMRQGPLKVTGERWAPVDSRGNPATLGIQDHICEVECDGERGAGIFELSYGS